MKKVLCVLLIIVALPTLSMMVLSGSLFLATVAAVCSLGMAVGINTHTWVRYGWLLTEKLFTNKEGE